MSAAISTKGWCLFFGRRSIFICEISRIMSGLLQTALPQSILDSRASNTESKSSTKCEKMMGWLRVTIQGSKLALSATGEIKSCLKLIHANWKISTTGNCLWYIHGWESNALMSGAATSQFHSIKINQIHLPIHFLAVAIHQSHCITSDNMCLCGCLCSYLTFISGQSQDISKQTNSSSNENTSGRAKKTTLKRR